MEGPISVGDVAPNFDLSSTEGALLMLKDEVVRTAVVLYFFADPEDERVRRDLQALSAARDPLAEKQAKILAVAPLKMDELSELQTTLELAFPLLRDDRGFSAHYGVVAPEEGAAPPALAVVDREQQIRWMANPAPAVEEALAEVTKTVAQLGSPVAGYPQSVINRVVNWWVN